MSNYQNEQSDNNLSAEIADRFILFLRNTSTSTNFTRTYTGTVKINANDANDGNKLKTALNENLDDQGMDDDIEEKLAVEWQTNVKKMHEDVKNNPLTSFAKDGLRIITQSPLRKRVLMLLPVGNAERRGLFMPKQLALPPAVLYANLILIAFVVSVFFGMSSPVMTSKIAGATDKIFDYPINQFYRLANLSDYKIDTAFFKKADRLIADSAKLKTKFILRNQDKLTTAKTNNKTFLVTKNQLLGLPVSASQNRNQSDKVDKSRQEKIDIVIWKISAAVEKIYEALAEKIRI